MKKFKMAIIGGVAAVTMLATLYLVYMAQKIEKETVATGNPLSIMLCTESSESAEEITDVINELEKKLGKNIPIKNLGKVKNSDEITEKVKGQSDNIDSKIISMGKTNLIQDTKTIVIKIPNKESKNHKGSLEIAEKIKYINKDIKVNIVETRERLDILNPYNKVEVSEKLSHDEMVKILDGIMILEH